MPHKPRQLSSQSSFISSHLYTLRALVRGLHAGGSSFGERRIPRNYLVWEILKIDSPPYKVPRSSHDQQSRPPGLEDGWQRRQVVLVAVVDAQKESVPC